MTNEEYQDQFELFVLGVADPEAAAEIQARLDAGDAEVARGVAQAREVVAGLALIAPEVHPPAALKRRLMASIGQEPERRSGWLWIWAAATALLAFMAFNFYQREQLKAQELAAIQQEMRGLNTRYETVAQILEFLNEPQLKIANFGQPTPQPPRGRILVSPAKGVLLLVSNLPPAPEGRTYEMWLVPKGGAPVPAGLFQTDASGRALHINPGTVDLSQVAAIAVSNEPSAGSTAPTTTPFIIAPVGD
jgi:anti-sigma-K factor RskA